MASKYFTQYWTNDQWKLETDHANRGYTALDHTAGNQFRKAGVGIGDVIFVVTVKKGQLFLGGKIVVTKLCSQSEAENLFKTDFGLYQANEHLIGSKNPDRFRPTLKVPVKIVEALYFESSDGPKPLKFKSQGVLDQQTLRGVRRLTPRSAEELSKLL
ncbi:hypothetical protein DFR30_0198 [Thiogranum longum]|uniref:EVE domain-containing protein n=1 Tax=Thiogranum longum TaxID=1537524 RepID=A0A4R1H730_9GAMM|nr:hypothetical protein [Thiogranum longum]TCK16978.1 hypothetical protein DFR30_0198 [Thiogranum longum]